MIIIILLFLVGLGYSRELIQRNGKYKRYIELLTEINGKMLNIAYFFEIISRRTISNKK